MFGKSLMKWRQRLDVTISVDWGGGGGGGDVKHLSTSNIQTWHRIIFGEKWFLGSLRAAIELHVCTMTNCPSSLLTSKSLFTSAF